MLWLAAPVVLSFIFKINAKEIAALIFTSSSLFSDSDQGWGYPPTF